MISLTPIGMVHSPYKEKFGIPRQSGLANSLVAQIELLPGFNQPDMVRGLEQYSHLWVLFYFSASAAQGWQPTVRPPRLGGNKRMGVLATRSPFRPNPIGLSVVELVGLDTTTGIRLHIQGADLLDQTPVLDIKPYIPYSDTISDVRCPFLAPLPEDLTITYSELATCQCDQIEQHSGLPLRTHINEVLRCDPRPAYQRSDTREYGLRLYDWNIRWQAQAEQLYVLSVEPYHVR